MLLKVYSGGRHCSAFKDLRFDALVMLYPGTTTWDGSYDGHIRNP